MLAFVLKKQVTRFTIPERCYKAVVMLIQYFNVRGTYLKVIFKLQSMFMIVS